ncbi:MAG TPA: hypothetical protein VMT51_13085 [Dongiaceae bacterium]|nr:hypothetical protein [Dongiaceae bacterium]
MKHSYRTYGLTLQSDLPLTGLSALPDRPAPADLSVELSGMPAWACEAYALPVTRVRARPEAFALGEPGFSLTEYEDGRYLQLSYADGTRFLLDDAATRLWGESGPGLSHDDLCVYLLGPVMGFIARRRGKTPLHASAVSIQGSAVAFFGEAGAGKSTTAAALALRGWPVLSEDVCIVESEGAHFSVVPGYPRVCLWPDSVQMLLQRPDALPLIVQGWEKRYLPLDGARAGFAKESAPLSAIFLLGNRENSAPRIESLSQREAILYLVQHTYMNWLLDPVQRAAEFDELASLVASVVCFRVTPSEDPALLPGMIDLIEAHAQRLFAQSPPHRLVNAASCKI